MDLSISNIIEISVSQVQSGIGNYNTSNLALFTREVPGGGFGSLGYKIYLAPKDVGVDFGTSSETFAMANAVFSQQPNILANNGYLVVIPYLSSETLDAAIVRTQDLIQYFGLMTAEITSQANMLAAAAVVQALNKIAFFVSRNPASIAPGGLLDLLRTGNFTKSRGLFYGGTTDAVALGMMAAYAGRGLSTNFDGSNTTQTMQLKDLAGVQPDPSMTQSLYQEAKDAGADIYASFEGVPKVVSFGANSYFDQVYNLGWFVGALKVAGFNYLAQSSTKVPQTENGVLGLVGAYRNVCEQAVANEYSAPGQWNSATTFGNQDNFLKNISQRGYYIFSSPIVQQSQADREARKAPLIQIALKEAGAIHSSTVIVTINA